MKIGWIAGVVGVLLTLPATAQQFPVPGTATACRLLEFSSGLVHEFHNFGTAQGSDWRITRMRDRFDNRLDVTYAGTSWQLTDLHGRTLTIRFAAPNGAYKKVLSVEVPKFGGGAPAVYTFSYRTETIESHGFPGTPCHSVTVTVDLLDRIVQPDGSFWEMGYYLTDDSGEAISGALERLHLPTGGALAWAYQQIEFPSQDPQLNGPDPVRVSQGVATRSLFENESDATPIGAWEYNFKTVGVDLPRVPGDGNVPCQLGGNFSMPAANSPWVLGTFTESRMSEGGQTAIEEFCFDTSTGFLERHRTLAGASRANGDLLQVMSAATTGHVETELFYGGDALGSMDNVYSSLCEMSLSGLDAQYQLEHTWTFGSLETTQWIDPCDNTLELLSVDNSIDQSTGMVSVSRDPASVAVSYDFGAMGRLIAERVPQGAWIEIEYTLPTVDDPSPIPQVLTQTCSNGVTDCSGASLLTWHRIRLTSGEVTVGTQDRVQSVSYDVYGNLLSLTTNGSTLTTSTSASTNRLTSFSALYDAGGNLTRQIRGGETHQYTFDPLGVMKYLQSTTDQAQVFLYDVDDERLATYDCFPGICDSPGWELRTTVRGLGGEPLREYSTQGVDGWHWVRDYVYRAGGLLAAVEPNEQGGEDVFHFHLDHLGTPRQVTNAASVQVALHSYYPFGQEATLPTQTSFTKKFTGHERDGNSTVGELDYMHARFGSPALGRFLSFDPIGGNRHVPQSWNRYAYALNSPMNYTDPEGLSVVPMSFMDLYFAFDEITIYGRYPWDILTFFRLAGTFFSDDAPAGPPELGEVGYLLRPAYSLIQALNGVNELDQVRFGIQPSIIDTGGVPEFAVFLPLGRMNALLRTAQSTTQSIRLLPAVTATKAGQLSAEAASKGLSLSRHAIERLALRESHVSVSAVQRTIQHGRKFLDPKNGSLVSILNRGMASGESILVAQNPETGLITTVITGNNLIRSRFLPLE